MKWHVFTMDDYYSGHESYREARRMAQGSLGVNRAPTRIRPGFYELYGRNNPPTESSFRRGHFFIATTKAALTEGWTEDRLRRSSDEE